MLDDWEAADSDEIADKMKVSKDIDLARHDDEEDKVEVLIK